MALGEHAGGLIIGAALMLTGIGLLLLFLKQFVGGGILTPIQTPEEQQKAAEEGKKLAEGDKTCDQLLALALTQPASLPFWIALALRGCL